MPLFKRKPGEEDPPQAGAPAAPDPGEGPPSPMIDEPGPAAPLSDAGPGPVRAPGANLPGDEPVVEVVASPDEVGEPPPLAPPPADPPPLPEPPPAGLPLPEPPLTLPAPPSPAFAPPSGFDERPELFVGGAFAGGLVLALVLKRLGRG